MEVGISKKLPSFNEGMNSLPTPGNVSAKLDHTLVVRTSQPELSKPFPTKPKIVLNPIQVIVPSKIRKVGIDRNVPYD